MNKPSNENEFKDWLKENYSIDLDNETSKTYFDLVMTSLFEKVTTSDFWLCLADKLHDLNEEYANGLFADSTRQPNLCKKSYDSVINKMFRHNIINNNNFPNQPCKDWILPNNTFASIDDLLRTQLVCRHLDGLDIVMQKLTEMAESLNLEYHKNTLELERGYYAYHFYVKIPTTIGVDLELLWNMPQYITIEIQLTTQLQIVLYDLTHKLYEEFRIKPELLKEKQWKWDYSSKRFKLAYMSHTLHMLEGIIVELRKSEENDEQD